MKKILYLSFLTSVSMLSYSALAEEITCTASPDCETLGYTQSECPKGGIRCPFDKSKMFCVSGFGGEDFRFKNNIYQNQVVFSDGSTGTYYDPTKDAIGIVTYVHPNAQNNHGLIMSLEQPSVQSRDFAIKYCANYTTKGTKVGDWHLADIGEISTMQNGDVIDNSTQFTTLNTLLSTIPGAQALGVSFSYYYSRQCKDSNAYLWVDCDVSGITCPNGSYDNYFSSSPSYPTNYLNIGGYANNWYPLIDSSGGSWYKYYADYNPAPGCVNVYGATSYAYLLTSGYPFYYSSSYWSASDNPSGNQPYVADLHQINQITTSNAQKGHFRCVAIF